MSLAESRRVNRAWNHTEVTTRWALTPRGAAHVQENPQKNPRGGTFLSVHPAGVVIPHRQRREWVLSKPTQIHG